ncbi:hypothetical protein LINPERPRIM_LOCUS2391 [Linum perenne]
MGEQTFIDYLNPMGSLSTHEMCAQVSGCSTSRLSVRVQDIMLCLPHFCKIGSQYSVQKVY